MTAVKLTHVAHQKNVFIISIVTLVTNIPIEFTKFKNSFLDLNEFPLFLYVLSINCDLDVLSEIFATAWASS